MDEQQDIFDQVAQSAQQGSGDIFDQVASAAQPQSAPSLQSTSFRLVPADGEQVKSDSFEIVPANAAPKNPYAIDMSKVPGALPGTPSLADVGAQQSAEAAAREMAGGADKAMLQQSDATGMDRLKALPPDRQQKAITFAQSNPGQTYVRGVPRGVPVTDDQLAKAGISRDEYGAARDYLATRSGPMGVLSYHPVESVEQMGAGAQDLANSGALNAGAASVPAPSLMRDTPKPNVDLAAKGATELMSGTMGATKPLIAAGVTNIQRTAVLYGAGILLGEGAGTVSQKMGATPNEQEFFKTVAFFVPDAFVKASGFRGMANPEVARFADPVTGEETFVNLRGGVVSGRGFAAGVAKGEPGQYQGAVRVGPYSARVNVGGGRVGVDVGREQPANPLFGNPQGLPSEGTPELLAAPPDPVAIMARQRAQAVTDAAVRAATTEKAAQDIAAGVPPPKPPSVPKPAGMDDGALTQDVITHLATGIRMLPTEQQAPAVLEATDNLAKWLLSKGTVVGPDGKVITVDSPKSAKSAAVKIVNDEVERQTQIEVQRQQQAQQQAEQQQQDADTARQEQEATLEPEKPSKATPERPQVPDTPVTQRARQLLRALPEDATSAKMDQHLRDNILLPAPVRKAIVEDEVSRRAQEKETVAQQVMTGQPIPEGQNPDEIDNWIKGVKDGEEPFAHIQKDTTYRPKDTEGLSRTKVDGAGDASGIYYHDPEISGADIRKAARAGTLEQLREQWKKGREAESAQTAEGTGITFTTSKGSVYKVHEDGTTTRNKAYRPEHGEAEQGIQPRSEQTFYVTPDEAQKLGEIQAAGPKRKLQTTDRHTHAGVLFLEGQHAGKYSSSSLVPIEREPRVGLIPVELWNGGSTTHFGNEIAEVRGAAPKESNQPKSEEPKAEKPSGQPAVRPFAKGDQVTYTTNTGKQRAGEVAFTDGRIARIKDAKTGTVVSKNLATLSMLGAGYADAVAKEGAEYARKAVPATWKELVRFTKQSGKSAKKIGRELTAAFMPTALADSDALDILGHAAGEPALRMFEASQLMTGLKKMFEEIGPEQQIEFVDRWQTGRRQPNPDLQNAQNLMQSIIEAQREREVEAINFGREEDDQVELPKRPNYFPNRYSRAPGSEDLPTEEQQVARVGGESRRSFAGSRTFLKNQSYTLKQAVAKGAVPLGTPVDMLMRRLQEGAKFVAAQYAMHNFREQGVVTFVRNGDKMPDGYADIQDSIAKVWHPVETEKGDAVFVQAGKWVGQKDATRLLNNYLSADHIRGSEVGTALINLKNVTTEMRLALSPFHFGYITLENFASGLQLGLDKFYNEGIRNADTSKIVDGLAEIGKAITQPYKVVKVGGSMLKLAQDPDLFLESPEGKRFARMYPDFPRLQALLHYGGLRWGMADTFRQSFADGFQQAMQNGELGKGFLKAVPWVSHALMKPLFEHYIPRSKWVFAVQLFSQKLAQYSHALAAGTITEETIAREVAATTDNRFGELNWDSLYLHNTLRTASQIAFRSATWKLGAWRGLGSAAKEQFSSKMFDDRIFDRIEDEADKWDSVRDKTRRLPQLGANAGWILSMGLVAAVVGSAIGVLATRKWPWEWADEDAKNNGLPKWANAALEAMHPRTGELDQHGRPIRLSLPTGLKDYEHGATEPGRYVKGSLSDVIGNAWDTLENRDAFGNYVYNPADPAVKAFMQGLTYNLRGDFLPMSVANYGREYGAQDAGSKLARATGMVGGAPRSLDETPALQRALSERKHEPETPEQEDAYRLAQQQPPTRYQVLRAARERNLTYLDRVVLHELSYSQAKDIYDNYANAQEKQQLKPIIERKRTMEILRATTRGFTK